MMKKEKYQQSLMLTYAYKKVAGMFSYMFYPEAEKKVPTHHKVIDGITKKMKERKPKKLNFAPPAEVKKLQKNEKLTQEEKKKMRL